ncbi:MAG TPA: histidine kinase [Gemmatimonadales bacterium]|nr:histidine kinase [Gemmatimonadales bacterium]
MTERPALPAPLRRGGLLNYGIWTAFGLLAAGQQLLMLPLEREHVAAWRVFALALPTYWYWAAVTPLVVALGRRVPPERGRLRAGLVHLGAALGLGVGHALLAAGLSLAVWPPMGETAGLVARTGSYLASRLSVELLTYFAILGVTSAVAYYRRARERELTAARLEAELAQAQLQALRMQLHPHFLFNTLHAIAVLIREDPAAAARTVTLLGDLLRHTLAHAATDEVPLAHELEFLQRYLEIERTRFQDRLTVAFDVAPETRAAAVPQFVLQPLVENAVRYGIARRAAPGRIEVSARREADALRLAVWNEGPSLAETARDGTGRAESRPDGGAGGGAGGIGLAATRGRLERLYGARGALELRDDAARGGVEAVLTLPFAEADPV